MRSNFCMGAALVWMVRGCWVQERGEQGSPGAGERRTLCAVSRACAVAG